jgi:hypothetical protein
MKRIITFAFGGIIGVACVLCLNWLVFRPEAANTDLRTEVAPTKEAGSLLHPSGDVASGRPWPILSSENLEFITAELRAFGCPERFVRDIVIAEANKNCMEELRRFRQRSFSSDMRVMTYTEQMIRSFKSINEKRVALLRKLFDDGIILEDELIGGPYRDPLHEGFILAHDKAATIRQIEERLSQEIEAIRLSTHGFYLDADRARIKELTENRDTELQKVLSPDEYAAFKLQSYLSSAEFKEKYRNFEPTLSEVAALKKYDNRRANLKKEPDIEVAQQEMNNELFAAMSPERIQQFKRFQDPAFRETVALARRFDLPDTVADQLVLLKLEALRVSYMHNSETTPASDAERNVFAQELSAAVEKLLGKDAAHAYRTSDHASWLR